MPALIATKDAYKRGLFTDCTVKCQSEVFKCHKIILCAHSEVFAAALTGSFKEATDNTIELHDESPEEISAFLDILYGAIGQDHCKKGIDSKECTVSWEIPPKCMEHGVEDFKDLIHTLDAHVRMYALADRLSAPTLKEHSIHHTDLLLRNHSCVNVTPAILSNKIVQDIYTTTPDSDRGLRDLISNYLGSDVKVALESPQLPKVLQQADGFAMDMLVLAAEPIRRAPYFAW